MKDVGIFWTILKYCMAIWYNLLTFGKYCCHLVLFSRFGMFEPRKIWQPWTAAPTFNCPLSIQKNKNYVVR
jgi:hypothetical protein